MKSEKQIKRFIKREIKKREWKEKWSPVANSGIDEWTRGMYNVEEYIKRNK